VIVEKLLVAARDEDGVAQRGNDFSKSAKQRALLFREAAAELLRLQVELEHFKASS
jgi:hypothetical protein